MSTTSSIGFSAQFGGRDAAEALLPHFKLLKQAAVGIELTGFSFPELAYILRVDGEVNAFGPSGPSHLAFAKDGTYVSVDIQVTSADRSRLGPAAEGNALVAALTASTRLLKESRNKRLRLVDFDALSLAIEGLCERYLALLRAQVL